MRGWKRDISPEVRSVVINSLHALILILSVLLIVFISIDTFRHAEFLRNRAYMHFQFWVCIVFIADFFIEWPLAPSRGRYFRHRLLFLLLSIPWLNILNATDMHLTENELYWVRFIPLARGVLAMSIVVGYVSRNRITSVFASYTSVMLAFLYIGSLIFLYREHPVNPGVPDFGAALWWACMDATTTGCEIQPVTLAGKVVGMVLAGMGMVMFPLFTVYITNFARQLASPRVRGGVRK